MLSNDVKASVFKWFIIISIILMFLLMVLSLPYYLDIVYKSDFSNFNIKKYLAYYFVVDCMIKFLIMQPAIINKDWFISLPVKKADITIFLIGRNVFNIYNLVSLSIITIFNASLSHFMDIDKIHFIWSVINTIAIGFLVSNFKIFIFKYQIKFFYLCICQTGFIILANLMYYFTDIPFFMRLIGIIIFLILIFLTHFKITKVAIKLD